MKVAKVTQNDVKYKTLKIDMLEINDIIHTFIFNTMFKV
jgi:hypothetical protein